MRIKPKNAMYMWTDGYTLPWMRVQAQLRGYMVDNENGARVRWTAKDSLPKNITMQRAMNQYFRHTPVRAPYVPPGETVDGSLFRGILMTPRQYMAFMTRKVWTDKGYMAFSTDVKDPVKIVTIPRSSLFKNNFGTSRDPPRTPPPVHRVIFVLRRLDVPSQTPWAWYGRPRVQGQRMSKNKLLTRHGPTNEVLLPPGMLYGASSKHDSQTNITYVKVRYVRLSVARKNAKTISFRR